MIGAPVGNLTECEYVWEVTYTSMSDGHRLSAAHFTTRQAAEACAKTMHPSENARVIQTTLYHTHGAERWFKAHLTEVFPDQQSLREQALAKLSPQERQALGLCS